MHTLIIRAAELAQEHAAELPAPILVFGLIAGQFAVVVALALGIRGSIELLGVGAVLDAQAFGACFSLAV